MKKNKVIQVGSFLDVIDNLGVKTLKCIKILGGYKKQYAKIGDLILCSIQKINFKKSKKHKIKKGDLIFSILVQTKDYIKRSDGQQIKFLHNSVVLLDKQKKVIATRISSPICKEFKKKNFLKLISVTPKII